MADSGKDPFSSATPEASKSWVPMLIGGLLVVVLLGFLVLLTRAGKSAAINPADPNLARVQLSSLHMATAQNFAGGSVTYIEGKITNGADRKLNAAQVELLFKNSLGETAQKENSLALTVLLPNSPYVDYGTLDRAPLAPGQSRDFRITLEHVSADWDGQLPQVKVISIGY